MPTYFKNLDALRFYAFFLVFIGHVALGFSLSNSWFQVVSKHINLGDVGVLFFFVLSGFLITTLLIRERKSGEVNIKAFYIRRIKRIWPVYYVVIFFKYFLVGAAIYLLSLFGLKFDSLSGDSLSALPWFLLFMANIYISYNGFLSPILNVLWSVSVEEQFYLVWPIFLKHFYRFLFLVTIFLIFFSIYFRYKYYDTLIEDFHTFSVVGSLATGSLGALICAKYDSFVNYFKRSSKLLSLSIYLVAIFFVSLRMFEAQAFNGNQVLEATLPAILAFAFLGLILEQSLSEKPLISFGRIGIINYFGKISYGLYAYHMISFTVVTVALKLLDIRVGYNIFTYIICVASTFFLTVIISSVSYRYLERPILGK